MPPPESVSWPPRRLGRLAQRLDDLTAWYQQMAANLDDLTHRQKRLALDALGVSVRVPKGDGPAVPASIPLNTAPNMRNTISAVNLIPLKSAVGELGCVAVNG